MSEMFRDEVLGEQGEKIYNTCFQNSRCLDKLSRSYGDLYPGFVEPCHNIPRLLDHLVT
jgi:hypothetical protein